MAGAILRVDSDEMDFEIHLHWEATLLAGHAQIRLSASSSFLAESTSGGLLRVVILP